MNNEDIYQEQHHKNQGRSAMLVDSLEPKIVPRQYVAAP